jgi:hypothetical protein
MPHRAVNRRQRSCFTLLCCVAAALRCALTAGWRPEPAQAALGGAPSRLGLVHAFLRVKEGGRGALDFDQVGPGEGGC